MQAVDKTRWAQLSPLLDELLELEPEPRAARLRTLREADEAAADVLADLLGRLTSVEREGFLETPAMLPEASMAGESIGAYTLARELGQGGMGSVWLARRTDGRYEGRVAVKFLNMALMARGGAERFAREGNILARLAHPNIARLMDAGVARGGQPYLVLEYIDGEPIDRYCGERALDTTARVRLFLDVLGAVAHAHNRLILHRDIKPGNILVTQAGEVKLLDFGIAKLMDDAAVPAQATELTQAAGRAFTPAYAAPEQVQGGDVTTATDVYALGVLLYVLLGGPHPTGNATSTPLDQLRAVVETQPKRLSDAVAQKEKSRALRGDLDNIVAKALKKAPGERYANAAAFADDLQRYLIDEPIAARPDAATYLVAKFVRRHRLGVAASAAIVFALAGGVVTTLWQAREARQQQVQAEGLIEFMLGDLRKKLQPVGRLDVLDAVGEKALAYYDAQAAGRLDADSLGRRARALHLIGEITDLRGNLEQALKVFQRAADSTHALMERAPNDGQRIFDHAQSVYWVGYIAWRRGQLPQAELAFKRYLELAQRLVAIDPAKVDWQIEVAHAQTNVGIVLLDRGQPAQARQALLQARAGFERSLAQRPELQSTLLSNYGWASKVEERLGHVEGAIEAVQSQLRIHRQRSDEGENRQVQEAIATATSELARLELNRGLVADAQRDARTAVQMFESLRAADADNKLWAQELAAAYYKLAEAQLAARNPHDAAASADRALATIESLGGNDAAVARWQINLRGRALVTAAEIAASTQGETPNSALEAWLALVSQRSLNYNQRQTAARARLGLGDAYSRAGRRQDSLEQWRLGTQLLASEAESIDPLTMAILAHLWLRLDEPAKARALVARVGATDFRHPVYADLLNRLAGAPGAPADRTAPRRN